MWYFLAWVACYTLMTFLWMSYGYPLAMMPNGFVYQPAIHQTTLLRHNCPFLLCFKSNLIQLQKPVNHTFYLHVFIFFALFVTSGHHVVIQSLRSARMFSHIPHQSDLSRLRIPWKIYFSESLTEPQVVTQILSFTCAPILLLTVTGRTLSKSSYYPANRAVKVC